MKRNMILTPGPTPVPQEVLLSMAKPTIHHRTAQFRKIFKEVNDNLADAEKTLNKRIAQQEGTAKDLLQLPVIGRLVLFLRGLQRPVWGFFVMYIDYLWFTTPVTYTEQQQTALMLINILVLGFLFGERTLKNLEPLILKVFAK